VTVVWLVGRFVMACCLCFDILEQLHAACTLLVLHVLVVRLHDHVPFHRA